MSANLFRYIRRVAVVRTDASANLALLWESVVSGFHGEALLNLEKRTLLSVGLADRKSSSREWNFDRDGRHRERHRRKLLASYEVS